VAVIIDTPHFFGLSGQNGWQANAGVDDWPLSMANQCHEPISNSCFFLLLSAGQTDSLVIFRPLAQRSGALLPKQDHIRANAKLQKKRKNAKIAIT